jgi:sulfur carrier protein
MKVRLLPERREVAIEGRMRVADVLRRLDMLPGTVMVIRGDELLTDEEVVEDDDLLEIRRVISGGSGPRA